MQRMKGRKWLLTNAVAVAWLGIGLIALARGDQPPTQSASSTGFTELSGKVVCLPEEMHQLHQADLPSGHEHIYGFRTLDGKYYTLLRTKFSEAIFADERIRQKELLLKGRVFP